MSNPDYEFHTENHPPYQGVIRTSKRPAGWFPPGPMPAGPQDREDLWPQEGEDLCFLTGSWRIFQLLKGHRYSIDDVATAYTALRYVRDHNLPIERTADIGCGIGSVLLMVAWGLPDVSSVGVEAQDVSFGLARRSIAFNGVEDRVEVRHGDLRDPKNLPEEGVFHLVTGTPPYIPIGHGSVSDKAQCGPCRFEMRGGIEEYCSTAARILHPEGTFVVCHSAQQVPRVEAALDAASLHLIERRDVVPREGRTPLFSLFTATHAHRDGLQASRVVDPLLIRDASGTRTQDYLDVRAFMGMP